MLYYKVEMGEGIAGPLSTVGAQTTALYSCIGIAMINEKEDLGGLYHYPAKTINHPVVHSAILAMINHVKPSLIYVTPALATMAGMGTVQDDLLALAKFLISNANGAKVQKKDPGAFASLFRDGGVEINKPHPEGKQPGRAKLDTVENEAAAGPRPLGNGAYYFGVNGEKHPEKLEPPPRSRSNSPSSRSNSPS